MAGFNKSIFVVFLMMFFISCVPQTKKTECGSDEAFNSQLRSCVPINPGKDEFITLEPISPISVTQQASSFAQITHTINVSNPYQRSYTIKWEWTRPNGTKSVLTSSSTASNKSANHPLSATVRPNSDLLGEVGVHIISVSALSGTNVLKVITFQVNLSNEPKPYANGFSSAVGSMTPVSPTRTVSFTVYKNGASLSSPVVEWNLEKLTGDPLTSYNLTQSVSTVTSTSENKSFVFNPANPMNSGVAPAIPYSELIGLYRLTAILKDGIEVYAHHTWDFNIAQNTIGKASGAFPLSNSTVTAYNGVVYSNASNFLTSSATKARFCVNLTDGDGTYGGGLRVSFYKEGGSFIASSTPTTALTTEVCLDSLNNTFDFNNTSLSNAEWNSGIYTQVEDLDTGTLYTNTPKWFIAVKPINTAPKIKLRLSDFNTTRISGCVLGLSEDSMTSCQVKQSNSVTDNSFSVVFKVEDDFAINDADFTYTATLNRGGSPTAAACTTGATPDDQIFECTFNILSSDPASGSIDPSNPLNAYSISLTVRDNGSPFDLNPVHIKTVSVTNNLTVQEVSTTPTITLQAESNLPPYNPVATVNEGDTVIFAVTMNEPDLDTYSLTLKRCTGPVSGTTCPASGSNLAFVPSITYPVGDYVTNKRLGLTIGEGFVLNSASESVSFLVTASETTGASAGNINSNNGNAFSQVVTITINNTNYNPVFSNLTAINPNVSGVDYYAMTGYPITLDPGSITDASTIADERQSIRRWWISNNVTGPWTEIDNGTNNRILRWTPGENITSGDYYIKLCISDVLTSYDATRYAWSDANGATPLCNEPAHITVQRNSTLSDASAIPSTSATGQTAVWVDTSVLGTLTTLPNSKVVYTAYPVSDGTNVVIRVSKFFYNANSNGRMDHLGTFEMDALGAGTTTSIADLSIIGDDNNLYIGYRAHITTAPGTYKPQVKRLVKNFDEGAELFPGKKTAYTHYGPFAFSYNGFTANLTSPVACDAWADGINVSGGGSLGGNWTDGAVTLDVSYIVNTCLANSATVQIGLSELGTTTISASDVDDAVFAREIATEINSNSLATTRGIIASVGTNVGIDDHLVTITGPVTDDSLQIESHAVMMGKLFEHNGRIVIPFINGSLPGADTNKVTFISFGTNLPIWDPGLVLTQADFTGLDTASYITTAIDTTGEILLGMISSATPGQAKLIKIPDPTLNATSASLDIFSGKVINKLKISADKTRNAYYYALGYSPTTSISYPAGSHWVGRVLTDLSAENASFRMQDAPTAATNSAVTTNTIYDFHIATAEPKGTGATTSNEARILLLTNNGLFAFRARPDNTVNCGNCISVSRNSVVPSTQLDASDVIYNMTIGTGGNSAAENARHIMLFGHITNDGADKMSIGLINTDTESINSTTTDPVNAYWRPAIFK